MYSFATEASIDLADDEELTQQMIRTGFDNVFIGIETPDDCALKECHKFQNTNRDLIDSVNKIQKLGLNVRGGFIVGFDNDSPEIFERQIAFIQESKIITAMVGMLNAPRGSRLYERLQREGRLLQEATGDNTDFSTNIIPRMGYEKLAEGYRNLIDRIYSPGLYYARVKGFLRQCQPLEKRKWHFNFQYLRWHFAYLGAPFKALLVLGIKDKARAHYWKLLLWSLFRRPLLLPLAITYSIYGFHFRKVFKLNLGSEAEKVCGLEQSDLLPLSVGGKTQK